MLVGIDPAMIGSFRISDDSTCDWGLQIELFQIRFLPSVLNSLHLIDYGRQVLLEWVSCRTHPFYFIYGAQLRYSDPFVCTINFMLDLPILNQLLLCQLLKILLHHFKRAHFNENRLFSIKWSASSILACEILFLWIAHLRRRLPEVARFALRDVLLLWVPARIALSEVHPLKNLPGTLSIKSFHYLPMIAIPIIVKIPVRRLGSSIFCSWAPIRAFASACRWNVT